MKFVVFGMLMGMLILASCGETEQKKETVKLDEEISDVQPEKKLVKEYETFVDGLNKGKISNSTVAMKKYQELFKDADKATCDSGFVVFHKFYEELADFENEYVYKNAELQKTVWNQTDENGKSEPMPKAFQNLERKVKPNGYRLEFPEGMISIGYDRSFIAKHFYKYVSPEMRKFLKELDYENRKGFSEDAGITIDETDYVDRLIWWENFEKANPDFILKKRVTETRKSYFTFFLTGMNNTPVYWAEVSEPMEMTDYFKTAYAYLERKYPRSDTWKRTKPYQQAVFNNDRAKTEKLLSDYARKGWVTDFSKN